MNVSSETRSSALRGNTTGARQLLSKVPEITIYFWIIKILCTTVGETFSDFLSVQLGFGLTATSVIMGIALAVVLFFQFRAKRYIPSIYWLTVVLISIFGTLVTDNLTDNLKVPLEFSTIFFSVALGLVFALWYASEKTLSIHSVYTARREAFYWLTILVTFALGTASGDLMAEGLGLGYVLTGVIVFSVIVLSFVGWRLGLDAILAFWIAYIMTRPLGASLGDYLSQDTTNGGLGLGPTITSVIFLGAIAITIAFLSRTKRDVTAEQTTNAPTALKMPVLQQVVAVVAVLVITSGAGYSLRQAQLQSQAQAASSSSAPLGDVSDITTIENDMLRLVTASDLAGAKARADDLERTWDNDQARLKAMNATKWTEVDGTIDTVLQGLRASQQDPAACKAALEASLASLQAPAQTTAPQAAATTAPQSSSSPLGDVSDITTIENDMLRLVTASDLTGAKTRADDLETTWDTNQAQLQPKDPEKWTKIDGTIDTVRTYAVEGVCAIETCSKPTSRAIGDDRNA